VVSRRRASTITMPTPRRLVASVEISRRSIRIRVIAYSEDSADNSVQEFSRRLSFLSVASRDVARAGDDGAT